MIRGCRLFSAGHRLVAGGGGGGGVDDGGGGGGTGTCHSANRGRLQPAVKHGKK